MRQHICGQQADTGRGAGRRTRAGTIEDRPGDGGAASCLNGGRRRKADKGDEAARTRPDTAVMVWYPGLAITVMPPAAGPARRALRAYFEDVAGRYYGRPPTEDEIAARHLGRGNCSLTGRVRLGGAAAANGSVEDS
jgi:hypothetical protein